MTNELSPLARVGVLNTVFQELAVKQFTNLQLAWRKAQEERDLPKLKTILDTESAFRKFVQDQDLGDELKDEITADYLRGERALGELWRERPKNKGAQGTGSNQYEVRSKNSTTPEPPTRAELGLNKDRGARDVCFADLELEKFNEIIAMRRINNDLSVFGVYADVKREFARRENRQRLNDIGEANNCDGVFDVLVIDPPWPLQKIERDIRPNQVELPYPAMTEDELLDWSYAREKAAQDCHVFLWTTHKFLPLAFGCLNAWEAKYCCTFVWHKPGGIQPINFPQLNCEFCLYARYGSPTFIDVKDFNACFEAPRSGHSEKPEDFYSLLRRVTTGRRIDMFNRRKIEGFVSWGNQAA